MSNIVFYNRSAIHYRSAIYNLLEDKMGMKFVFGDKRPGGIKDVPQNSLKNVEGELKNIDLGPLYWQRGVFAKEFLKYNQYLTPGDYHCLSNWLLLPLLKLKGKKIYFWTHGWYGNESWFKAKTKKLFFSFADGFFLYGLYAKNLMIDQGYKEEKLHVVYNSLDYERQKAIREKVKKSSIFEDNFKNKNYNLIFIGRLTTVKKLHMLILLLEKLKKDGLILNLTFIGDGVEKENLIDLAKEKAVLKQIWFKGSIYDELVIAEHLFNADLCISPGNVGLTAMHCLTYGVPVATHNDFANQVPEFEAITDGVTGYFFRNNDFDSLISKTKEWFKKQENADRDRLRRDCYKIIEEKYNPEYQIRVFEKELKN